MQQKLRYKSLLGQHDIRVIRLLTPADDPVHAEGPVHCEIVHVALGEDNLVTNAGSATKGSNGIWPVSVDITVNNSDSKTSQQTGFNPLFEKSLVERMTPFANLPVVPYFEGPKWLRESAPKVGDRTVPAWDPNQDEEASLPWRYTWGDFVALSYVWGDPSIRRDIIVDGVPISVTASLEGALRELRHHSRIQQGFFVWVDALCINQEDMDERSAQVAKMKDIYQAAWHVVIWLGPDENRSDLATLALRYISLHAEEEDVLDKLYKHVEFYIVRIPFMQWKHSHTSLRIRKAVLNAIYYLLARPYWRRLWIIQEVVLGSRNSPVLCGDNSILLKDIFRALSVMKADGDTLGEYVVFAAKGSSKAHQKWNFVAEDTYGISEKLWERPVAITALKYIDIDISAAHNGVYDCLLLSREANATDERDRVYGILGLPQIANTIKLIPDYNRTASETFTLFSALLLASGNVNGLRLVNSPVPAIGTRYYKSTHFSRPRSPKFVRGHRVVHRGCEHGLPSWVICWSCPRNPAQPFLGRTRPTSLSGLITPLEKPRITHDNVLIVKGVVFDTLASLSACHATESDTSYPRSAAAPPKSAYGDRVVTKEALARALTGDLERKKKKKMDDSEHNDDHDHDDDNPTLASAVMHQTIWSTGINGVDNNIFGLKDFYQRNRGVRLFDEWTLEGLVRDLGRAADIGRRVKESAQARPRILRVTATHREALTQAMRALAWRRLVVTERGYFGLVPAAAREGDVLAVVAGCDAPLLLREVGREGEEKEKKGLGDRRFQVIGEAYVHWVTGREIQEMVEEGTDEVGDIWIC
ncbi:HET-domain-containing protein [Daldinia caldariorum]|uniref:HET-domain-containing protein n=1 Tax=Daldinia caldariorum TaxID=326644 RepID=UPI002008D5E7|nr:HET-domain-containing protein [Daldinia caldariorum]KAI1472545.1 HET-domain-containing protein [Daldinia caldariorum]